MITDPIADMLTRIRNANQALHLKVEMPSSGMRREIARILEQEGYIEGFEVAKGEVHDTLVVTLKYGANRERVISGLKRVSKPGRRIYARKRPAAQGAGRHGRRHPVHVERRRHRPPGRRRRASAARCSATCGDLRMSRIGRKPITVPAGVEVEIGAGSRHRQGPQGHAVGADQPGHDRQPSTTAR